MARIIRPIRIDGSLAYIPLTQGYEATIDAADVRLVDGVNWCAHVEGHVVYAVRNVRVASRNKMIYLHRVLIGGGAENVDHRDGDGLNNRRTNLRPATRSQNMCNTRRHRDNKSGVKGVHFHKMRGKWTSQIRVGGRVTHLGMFRCRTAAQIAYAKASMSLHGEFGRLG